MTTPERLRRRQRIEGTFLLIIGVLWALSTLWFRYQDIEQRECLATNFGRFNDALTVRGELTEREAEATRMESQAERTLFADVFSSTTAAESRAAYAAYLDRLEEVDALRAEIRQARKETPIPDFPAGTCD